MTDLLRFAFIGAGSVAHLHAQALRRVTNAKLVGVWSRGKEKAEAFAAQYDIKSYRSIDELLQDSSVDAVAVLVYSETAAYGNRCLAAGKHVLLEKPIAASLAEIESLRASAAKAGRVCVPSHNYIYSPDLREAKRRVDDGDFGRLSSFWLIYNQKHPADIGFANIMTRDVMIHHTYAAIYFAGPPRRISASGTNVHFDDRISADQVMAVAEHENGVISNLWASFGVDDFTSSPWNVFYKLLGTEGAFQKNWNEAQFGRPYLPGWDKTAYRDSFYYVHDYFVNQCVLRGLPPLSGLDDAAAALRVIEGIDRSMAAGAKIDISYA